jgi:hypothetical protein
LPENFPVIEANRLATPIVIITWKNTMPTEDLGTIRDKQRDNQEQGISPFPLT